MKSKGNVILYRLYGKKRNSRKGKMIRIVKIKTRGSQAD